MTHVRPLHRSARLVVRRNAPFRLAGLGYAAITGAWLLAAAGHPGAGVSPGSVLFGALTLSGLLFALLRDDVILDKDAGTVRTVQGLPGLARTVERGLRDFERLTVVEESSRAYEEGASRPVRRSRLSVCLVDVRGGRLTIQTVEFDGSGRARSRALERAQAMAEATSSLLGIPVVRDPA